MAPTSSVVGGCIADINAKYQQLLETGVVVFTDERTKNARKRPKTVSVHELKSLMRQAAKELKRPFVYVRTITYNKWVEKEPGKYSRSDDVKTYTMVYIQRRRGTDKIVGPLLLAAETDKASKISQKACWHFSVYDPEVVTAWLEQCYTDPVYQSVLVPRA